ncbi:GTP-binding protein TypA/BipA [Candidatus Liberibacter asiaticus]|nr:GTP-binding protein TypA/BipA [Candidatus Liberibacter asiaticus]
MSDSSDGSRDQGMVPLLNLIVDHVPPPVISEGEFKMIGTILEKDPFLGRIVTGRIHSGTIKSNQNIKALSPDGALVEVGRVSKILAFRGIDRQPIDEAHAGDIVSIAGLVKATVADTFCDPSIDEPLKAQPIDPPTVTMTFGVNDSPLAGTEGDKVTSRMIRDRLFKEAEGNIALKIEESSSKDAFFVSGRGELQLAVLIETMRREGFELAVSRPRVVIKKEGDSLLEPIEEVVIDVDEEHSGAVVQKMTLHKSEMIELRPSGTGRVRLVFLSPTRGLIGYQSQLMTDTRGTAIMNRLFHSYQPHKGEIGGRSNGVLLSNEEGKVVAYALFNLEDRGSMIVEPGDKVYQGMIVGIHTRENDLDVNVLKGKKLTNMRASGKDEAVKLVPAVKMTLEQALSWIQNDELVEVTPKSIRLRKMYLDPNERKRKGKSVNLEYNV